MPSHTEHRSRRAIPPQMRALLAALVPALVAGDYTVDIHAEVWGLSGTCNGPPAKFDLKGGDSESGAVCQSVLGIHSERIWCDMSDPEHPRVKGKLHTFNTDCTSWFPADFDIAADNSCTHPGGVALPFVGERITCKWRNDPPPPPPRPSPSPSPHPPMPPMPPPAPCTIYSHLRKVLPYCDDPDSGGRWAIDLKEVLGPQCASDTGARGCCYAPLGYAGGPKFGSSCAQVCHDLGREGGDDYYCRNSRDPHAGKCALHPSNPWSRRLGPWPCCARCAHPHGRSRLASAAASVASSAARAAEATIRPRRRLSLIHI